jgi:hypothetical protein
MTSSQPLSEQYSNKLSQLEKLQYQLTRQVVISVDYNLTLYSTRKNLMVIMHYYSK